jgi:hypothetical protein
METNSFPNYWFKSLDVIMKLMFHLENMEMHWYIIYPIVITKKSYINHICIRY